MRRVRSLFVCAALAASLPPAAMAQPILGRVLSSTHVAEGDHCAVVKIGFNFPVGTVSYFPLASGAQLSIRLKPIEGASAGALLGRESIAAPQSAVANIADIEYEGDRPEGPTLTITFNRTANYRVAQGPDFLSVIVAVSDVPNNNICTPQSNPQEAAAAPPTLRPSSEVSDVVTTAAAPIVTTAPAPTAQSVLDQAKAAMTAGDYPRAIQLFTKFLQGPNNADMPDAQEMLGVARERNGQMAHAKAEYEEYLRRYPNAPGAGRVRQRLAALLARALHPEQQTSAPGAEPPAFQWESNASISEYYYHDELATTVHDQGDQITIDNGLTTLQSELVSAVDANVSMTGESFRAQLRASGSYTQDFLSGVNNETRIGELYAEISNISRTLLARFGRQYRSTGGVLGRIDGAFFSFGINDQFKIDVIGGFPVDSSYSGFSTQRYGYGVSVDYARGPFSGDIYAFRQMDDGFLDRQSVGIEGRYVDQKFSAFGTVDYDVYFNKLNIAIFNTNYIFPDQTSINLTADYRRAPMLRTSDALIGQPVFALSDLLSTYTKAEIEQLALDRTATSLSLYASLNHPLNDKFSLSFDTTFWNMTGMPESGGVPAIPSTGSEYYFSGHLIGTGLFTEGDLGMVGVGYAKMYQSDRYTFDLNTRYPITHDLRIGPRLFFSYRDIAAGAFGPAGSQIDVRPTLRLDYRIRPDLELEVDGGMDWERDVIGPTTTQTKNYLLDVGLTLNL